MISIRTLGTAFTSGDQRAHLWESALIVGGGIAVAVFILMPTAGLIAVIGCAAAGFIVVVSEVFRGKIDRTLLCWAALFPLSYFALFPREHSIITMERVVLFVGFLGLFFVKPGTLTVTPRPLRRTGFACLAFIVVAALSLMESADFPNAARTLFDGFVVPLLLGWLVIAWFDVRGRLAEMHTAACVSSIICAAIAAAEIVTAEDLLPVGNSVMFYAGGIPRPNGPFASNDALALVGGFSFFFLLFLRAALGPKLSAGRRLLHSIGIAAALGMALMPMFRSVAITLLIVLLIDTFWEKEATRRARRVVLMLACAGLFLVGPLFVPKSMIEDRSSSENLFGRVAQFEQNRQVFLEHPLLGVGFSNFHNYVFGEPRYIATYEGIASLDWQHGNLAQVLTETGILGFVPYMMMYVLLVGAMWQLRRVSDSGNLAWKYFVYLFLTYWITGMTESSGLGFSNIWFTFAVAVSYKYALTAPDSMQFAEAQVPDEVFDSPVQIA
jgi:hypothetical protein